jgi:ribosome maturation factor RimP
LNLYAGAALFAMLQPLCILKTFTYLCITSEEGTVKSPLFCFCIMNNREIIEAWLTPLMVEMDCFLVDVRINPSINKYEIFIDSPTGVTIEQCTKVSRFVEFQMDNDNRFSEKYSLDVSSPGMENPFKVQQQYDKNIGKTIEVVLLNGNKKEGLLKKADGKVLHLEVHHPPKKKGMKPEIELETYGFEEIKSVKKKIVF